LVAGGLLVATGARPAFLPVAPALLLHLYAALIAGFVAGMHWGIHFCKRTSDSVYLFSSVCIFLLWLSFLWAGEVAGLALVLLCFVLLWIAEYRFSQQRVTTVWFWKLRNLVSAIAVISLALAMLRG
ncbi:MAG TPA: DUF3429 domain-containing protein, partial [Hyphomicrobiales bacterium]|nr:DUF3429 domain-containing protein [Hyphomicrobiales bacterium]